jgi:hypothetical protein
VFVFALAISGSSKSLPKEEPRTDSSSRWVKFGVDQLSTNHPPPLVGLVFCYYWHTKFGPLKGVQYQGKIFGYFFNKKSVRTEKNTSV